ncbi:MAG TPA: glutamate synthase [Clostridia bacterium]|nr:MAG: Ferredoxin-dependent glutamate synthase 2 [Firmicutes bacterium ADurb.Bin146]HOD93280.1 glutamate synthase [Clostridia bacterium]HQM39332.1 glutamate synthase [Clostridia bacterium]
MGNIIRLSDEKCLGVRYLACGDKDNQYIISGTPGNALGAYLDGGNITVYGNAQDATGDTMNAGEITIHGSTGDAAGYAMRGGQIYIKKDAGYRAGIHMKQYKDKLPVMVIGGTAGSFLGEYQAGGIILVLGIGHERRSIAGNFCATGMHGGIMFLRTENVPKSMPSQVSVLNAKAEELKLIEDYITRYCEKFNEDKYKIMDSNYLVIRPNSNNPYRQLYCYS